MVRNGRQQTRTGCTIDAPSIDEPPPTVGRRGGATRGEFVDALLSLLEEGDLQPTANRIAERAGISLRLIYHHVEALFHAAAIRQGERIVQLSTPIPIDLPDDERLDLFVLQRATRMDTPVRRASLLQEPFSDELQRGGRPRPSPSARNMPRRSSRRSSRSYLVSVARPSGLRWPRSADDGRFAHQQAFDRRHAHRRCVTRSKCCFDPDGTRSRRARLRGFRWRWR